jgi:WD40 repeat protein
VFILKDDSARLTCVAFSPDGRRLAAGGEGFVRVWDLDARTLERKDASGPTRAVYFPADGANLLAQRRDDFVTVFRHGGALAHRPADGPQRYQRGCVSPDGRRACLWCWVREGECRLDEYRLPDFSLTWGRTFERGGVFSAMAYSGDGRVVAGGTLGESILTHDARNGDAARGLHGPVVEVKAVALSPDGGLVAWVGASHLHLWRLDPPEQVLHHNVGRTHFLSVAFHPSGGFFATANGDGKIDYWAADGRPLRSFDWGVGKLNGVAFDPIGDRAACCSQTGEVVVWDVDR